jgi:hypothetical protein
MKNLTCCILLMINSLMCSAQKSKNKQPCDFLGPLHFINGKATVVIKASFFDFLMAHDDPWFVELVKKKKLKYNDYFARCCVGSAISFVPENCTFEYSGTIKIGAYIGNASFEQTVYLTCVVFEGVTDNRGIPYFVIDGVSYKKDSKPIREDIKPITYIKSEYADTESGGSYFSDNTDSLSRVKIVLAINAHYLALVQTADNKFIHFSYKKRIVNEAGYIDFYQTSDSSSTFELNINNIITGLGRSSYRNGQLTLTINKNTKTFKVFGREEKTDEFSEPVN